MTYSVFHYIWTPEWGCYKDRRKLLSGKKTTLLGLMVSLDGGQRDKIQGLVNWAWYAGCLEHDFFLNCLDFQYLIFIHSFFITVWIFRIYGNQMKEWISAAKDSVQTPCVSCLSQQILNLSFLPLSGLNIEPKNVCFSLAICFEKIISSLE